MNSILSPGDTVKTDPSITIQNNVIILNYQITLFVGKQCFKGFMLYLKKCCSSMLSDKLRLNHLDT